MGAVRLLPTLAPLVLIAGLATACGGGSSSDEASGPTATSAGLQMRPVFARYSTGAPMGEQLGPQAPKELLDTLKTFDCSAGSQVVQGMLMVCADDGTVYLLKDPIVSDGVASAVAKPVNEKLWYVKVTLDPDATTTLSGAADTMTGTELAIVSDGHVISAPIIDSSMKDGTLGITGDYDEQQAKALADQLSQD
jgi:preprotein translocase subunit SecD